MVLPDLARPMSWVNLEGENASKISRIRESNITLLMKKLLLLSTSGLHWQRMKKLEVLKKKNGGKFLNFVFYPFNCWHVPIIHGNKPSIHGSDNLTSSCKHQWAMHVYPLLISILLTQNNLVFTLCCSASTFNESHLYNPTIWSGISCENFQRLLCCTRMPI